MLAADVADVSMKVIVTGGCGFVGRHAADAIADRGDRAVVLDIGGESWRDDVPVVHADLRDADAVRRACAGADAVIHSASVVHTPRHGLPFLHAVNVGGTQHVIDACRTHDIRRLVYVSSASVVYEGKDLEAGNESLPYARNSQAPYADTKIEAEQLVLAANGEGLATVAIRPHVVFGPGDMRLLPAILTRARAGQLKFRVGSGEHLSDFTFVDNLTSALLSALDRLGTHPEIGGEAYFVTNGEPLAFFEFIDRVLLGLDLPRPGRTVPYGVAYAAAWAAEMFKRLARKPIGQEDGMSRFAVRYLCTHHYFQIDKAKRDLGYVPSVSLEEGIRRTVAHLSERG
jgi:sterol-4alpha-carboxylate 3-dehydrogenase (decarboxylating)